MSITRRSLVLLVATGLIAFSAAACATGGAKSHASASGCCCGDKCACVDCKCAKEGCKDCSEGKCKSGCCAPGGEKACCKK